MMYTFLALEKCAGRCHFFNGYLSSHWLYCSSSIPAAMVMLALLPGMLPHICVSIPSEKKKEKSITQTSYSLKPYLAIYIAKTLHQSHTTIF